MLHSLLFIWSCFVDTLQQHAKIYCLQIHQLCCTRKKIFTEAADYEEGAILAAHKSKKLAFGGQTWA